jgi:hypothetical protein
MSTSVAQILGAKQKEIDDYHKDVGLAKKKGVSTERDNRKRDVIDGCWSWITGALYHPRHAKLDQDRAVAAPAGVSSRSVNQALFGMRPSVGKEGASARLINMADSVRGSADAQDAETERHRQTAVCLFKQGQKSKALRSLRKSKHTACRAASLTTAAEALEAQVDLLQQTELQQSVAEALKISGLSTSSCRNALSSLETAAEDAAEAAESVQEMDAAMDEVVSSSRPDHIDDDDLLQELEDMGAPAHQPSGAQPSGAQPRGAQLPFPSALCGRLTFPATSAVDRLQEMPTAAAL